MNETKEKYQEKYYDFKKILDIALEISSKTMGMKCPKYIELASWIFTKIIAHSYSLEKILPKKTLNEVWDLASIATLTRTVIDSYYMMNYIAINSTEKSEIDFRYLLFQYHSEKSRLDMLNLNNTNSEKLKELEKSVNDLLISVEKNINFTKLDKTTRQNIKKGKKAILLSNSELSKKSSINENYYKLVFKHLSNYVHSYPFAMDHLSTFRAGNSDAYRDMSIVITYATIYLSLSIQDFIELVPEKKIIISEKNSILINSYSQIAKS